jgi:hypothetical protein
MGLAFHRLNNAGARPRTRVRNTEKKALASHSSGFTGDLTRLSMEVPNWPVFSFKLPVTAREEMKAAQAQRSLVCVRMLFDALPLARLWIAGVEGPKTHPGLAKPPTESRWSHSDGKMSFVACADLACTAFDANTTPGPVRSNFCIERSLLPCTTEPSVYSPAGSVLSLIRNSNGMLPFSPNGICA